MSVSVRTILLILVAAGLGVFAACGPVRSTVVLIQADQALKEARSLGSMETAPYPTQLAEELIEKAREEQGYSSYDTATQLAEEAKALAEDAVKLARATAVEATEEGPAEEGPAEEGPAEEGPAEEGPAEEGPVEEGPAEEGQAEEGQAEEGQAEEGQAEEGPAEEGQAGEEPAP